MDVSIILLNYNMKGLLKQCLKGIMQSVGTLQTEVLVIDNASTDGTTQMISTYLNSQPTNAVPIRFFPLDQNRGYGVGNNVGIRQSRGKYILILNPDIAVFPGSIERLVEYLDAHDDVAVVGPKLLNPNGTIQYSCNAFPRMATPIYRRTPLGRLARSKKEIERYLMSDWDHDSTRAVDWVMGSAMLVRRQALDAVGLFDERFFMYFEDIDWCRRFWEAGHQVHYHPQSVMVHYHQRLSAQPGVLGTFSWATRTHVISAVKYFRKYHWVSHPPQRSAEIKIPVV